MQAPVGGTSNQHPSGTGAAAGPDTVVVAADTTGAPEVEASFTSPDDVGSPKGAQSSAQAELIDAVRGAAYMLESLVPQPDPQPSPAPPPPPLEPLPGRGPSALFSSEDPDVLCHFVRGGARTVCDGERGVLACVGTHPERAWG